VSSVTDMDSMFSDTPFNGEISGRDDNHACQICNCPIPEAHKPAICDMR
jgi:hypothetical protein